ncbi:MAG: peptidyl-prolyl cis-trans isomerase [Syntrophorhabdaceae bacterium]|nr:peptidyl-prolyl cis-trans isomerase [Syntrophorhabdaceae bacterium]
MKRILPLFIIPFLLLLQTVRAEVVDRIAAIVNDEIITVIDLERYVHVEKYGEFVSVNEYFRNLVFRDKIDALIENILIKQQAKKLKIDVSPKEINNMINSIKKQYLITDEELREQLKRDKISYNDFVEGLRTNAIKNKVLAQVISSDIHLTEKDLKDYYDKRPDDFREETYRLKQIFVSGKSEDPHRKVLNIQARLKKGESFEALAKEFSEDPSAKDGGDIGMIKRDELVPAIREALNMLKPGNYTDIIETPYGLLILKLEEVIKGGTIPFEEVKERIHEKIIREESERRYQDYIKKLRRSSYIEVKI